MGIEKATGIDHSPGSGTWQILEVAFQVKRTESRRCVTSEKEVRSEGGVGDGQPTLNELGFTFSV